MKSIPFEKRYDKLLIPHVCLYWQSLENEHIEWEINDIIMIWYLWIREILLKVLEVKWDRKVVLDAEGWSSMIDDL